MCKKNNYRIKFLYMIYTLTLNSFMIAAADSSR